jgi:ubiquinone/menaquinone biosynthesis C-methylase UbiE
MVQSATADRPIPGNVSFLVANAQNLPFSDRSVDHVVALGLFAYFLER